MMTEEWYEALTDRFMADSRTRFARLPVDEVTLNLSVSLIRRHPLRAYDAVQLASALVYGRSALGSGLSPVRFVSADEVLCTAARAEGLAATNPNDVPNDFGQEEE